MTLAHLSGLDLRQAADGWHGIWNVDGVTHQFWLPQAVPDDDAFYAVSLPMDSFMELRAHAARRFWRSLNGRAPGADCFAFSLNRPAPESLRLFSLRRSLRGAASA